MPELLNHPPEPALSDHDLLVQVATTGRADHEEIVRLREWRHDNVAPTIMAAQAEIRAVGEHVKALELNTLKLSEAMSLMIGLPQRQIDHETGCVLARREDMAHRDKFEDWVRQQFDSARRRQWALHATVGTSLLTAIGGMGWFILTNIHVMGH